MSNRALSMRIRLLMVMRCSLDYFGQELTGRESKTRNKMVVGERRNEKGSKL